MTKILKVKDIVRIIDADTEILESIDNGVYTVKYDRQTGEFYLAFVEKTTHLPKIYGSRQVQRVEKTLRTFDASKKNVGVFLTGYKGSGKTLFVQQIIAKNLYPVIMVSEGYHSSDFTSFIIKLYQTIGVFVLVFEEFDKLYTEEKQETLLTLFDGVIKTKILTIFSMNRPNVSEFLNNRLSRVLYHFRYTSLRYDEICEILDDLLKDDSRKQEIVKHVLELGEVSVDSLKLIAEEALRYLEMSTEDLFTDLNLFPTAYACSVTLKIGEVEASLGNRIRLNLSRLYRYYVPHYYEFEDFRKFEEDDEIFGKIHEFVLPEYKGETRVVVSIGENACLIFTKTEFLDSPTNFIDRDYGF